MSLRNMNIAPRALLGFALIGLLMLGLGIFSLVQMGNIRQAGEVIEQDNVPSIKILDELTGLNLRMRTLSYRLLVNRDAQTQRDTLNLLDQRNAQMDRAREAYVPMIRADDEQAAFDQLSQYRQLESRMRTLSQENRLDELSDMLNRDLMANSEQMNKVMDTLLPGAALRPIATQGRSYTKRCVLEMEPKKNRL
jgi:methyl-accepting chemotaxis protein